jgi:hypothetical protein
MTILLRTRLGVISAFVCLIWMASVQPATCQIFRPVDHNSAALTGMARQGTASSELRLLPDVARFRDDGFAAADGAELVDWSRPLVGTTNVERFAAWSADPPQPLAGYDPEAVSVSPDRDQQWLDSAIRPASYSEYSGDFVGPQMDGFTLGSLTVVPYGVLWTDMIYESSRTFPGRFILWIISEEQQGEDTFQIEARYSRVGFDVKGPEVDLFGGIRGGARVEIDFLGGFTVENQPDARLRHAYWEAKNEQVRFLIGQYWDLVSPRLPNTVNFSVSWGVGNVGFRRAQFRMERYIHLSDNLVWTLQGALAQNVIQDFAGGGPGTAGVVRETGNWPMIQGRTAFSFGRHCREPITVGVSGHIGETGFDFNEEFLGQPKADDQRYRTWSFNVDAKVPLTDRCGLHGEFFTGANLSPILGGIVQGVCPCLRVPIRSSGGWLEAWYDVTPNIHTHVGFGIDNPIDRDSVIGRTNNQVVYGNVFLDLTEHLITGLEVSSWRTGYHNKTLGTPDEIDAPTDPGESVAIDWTVRYKF